MKVLDFLLRSSSPYQKYLWGMFITLVCISIDGIIKPVLIKLLIDKVANQSTNVWYICGLYALSQVLFISSWSLNHYFSTKFSSKYSLKSMEAFIKRLYHYSHNFFHKQQSGNIISKVNDSLGLSTKVIFTIINNFSFFLLNVFFSLVILFTISKVFSLALLIWLCLFFSITFFAYKKNIKINHLYAEERANVFGAFADYITNIFSVKVFVKKDFELQRFQKLKSSFEDVTLKQGFYFIKIYLIQGIVTALYVIGFIIFLIKGYYQNIISAGDIALVFMVNIAIISNIFPLANVVKEFVFDWGAIDNALEMIENVPEVQDKPRASSLKVGGGAIIFDKINFNYPNCEMLFENQSVVINSKQKVGLVGFSGAGKSSFVNLILRFYDLKGGKIKIDDQDISMVTQDSLRKNISMISQEPILFHRSLMENIRYGNVNATDEEVIAAAKIANAYEFIEKLPLKYNTLVGERGVKLSGGQRQRIAMARSVLKDAPILILDEATSQLDSITESYIQKALFNLMRNKTVIVIAHRLSTLLDMDRILVFDKGKIIQDGSHKQLLSQDGLYRAMWNAQVGGFLPNKSEEMSLS